MSGANPQPIEEGLAARAARLAYGEGEAAESIAQLSDAEGGADQRLLKQAKERGQESLNILDRLLFGPSLDPSVLELPEVKKEVQELALIFAALLQKLKDEGRFYDEDRSVAKEAEKETQDAGMHNTTLPKQFGGRGLDLFEFAFIQENISTIAIEKALQISGDVLIGLKGLIPEFGTSAQQNKWMPLLVDEQILSGFALTEPNAGTNIRGVSTVAEYDEESKTYRISGKKLWITNARYGGAVGCVARDIKAEQEHFEKTGKQKLQLSVFMIRIPSKEECEERGDIYIEPSGTAAFQQIDNSYIEFNNFPVPVEDRIPNGLHAAIFLLGAGRAILSAKLAGHIRAVAADTLHFGRNRSALGGGTLFDHELPRESYASIESRAVRNRALSLFIANLKDQGHNVGAISDIVKIFGTTAAKEAILHAKDIQSGRAYQTDNRIQIYDASIDVTGTVEGQNKALSLNINKLILEKGQVAKLLAPLLRIFTESGLIEAGVRRITRGIFFKRATAWPALKALAMTGFSADWRKGFLNTDTFKLAAWIAVQTGKLAHSRTTGLFIQTAQHRNWINSFPREVQEYARFIDRELKAAFIPLIAIPLVYGMEAAYRQKQTRQIALRVGTLITMLANLMYSKKMAGPGLERAHIRKVLAYDLEQLKQEYREIPGTLSIILGSKKSREAEREIVESALAGNSPLVNTLRPAPISRDWRESEDKL